MISVKRDDKTSAITSNLNYKEEDLNKFKNQRQKTKLQARWFGKQKGSIFNSNNATSSTSILSVPIGEIDKHLQNILKSFTEDFLAHAFGELVNACHQELYKTNGRVIEQDYIHYFVILGFSLECGQLK